MKVYFIGIGGIGVSALAQYYLAKGAEVFGSDLTSSEITDLLKEKGAKIFIGPQKAENISQDLNLIIYSPAVQENNPELEESLRIQKLNSDIQIMSYPQALGRLTKDYFTIAVSGSHGKSTTSAMISLILIKAGLDPTVIIGTKLKEFGNSNFRLGGVPQSSGFKSKFLVIEADEYQASFLNYWPSVIVLTNIEEEHLDFFGSMGNIFRAFRDYLNHLPEEGFLVINYDDENVRKIRQTIDIKHLNVKPYSLTFPEAGQVGKILKIPGEHNVSNALAALTTARALGIKDEVSFKSLSDYEGAWRRFEIREARAGDKKFTLVSDYAHHPTEIKATLRAAKEKWPNQEIWVVFQPHQHQRTFYLFDRLVRSFVEADIKKIILVPIYDVAGRETEEINKKVSSLDLVEAIKKERTGRERDVFYMPGLKETESFLENNLRGGEIVIIMGAGDIYELTKMFST